MKHFQIIFIIFNIFNIFNVNQYSCLANTNYNIYNYNIYSYPYDKPFDTHYINNTYSSIFNFKIDFRYNDFETNSIISKNNYNLGSNSKIKVRDLENKSFALTGIYLEIHLLF